jgi:hypothetical protein
MWFASNAVHEANHLSSVAGQFLTRGLEMFTRGLATLSMLAALSQGATADEKPNLLHRVSCAAVRFYVAKFSEVAAEAWARSHGATEAEIERARSCLSGSNTHG